MLSGNVKAVMFNALSIRKVSRVKGRIEWGDFGS